MSIPWMKFYPSDWRADPKLRMCSIGARGLWIEMICVMHEAEPYGFLVSNGRAVTPRQLAALAGISQNDCVKYLRELESAGVYSIDDEQRIYSRRMVRDKAKADRDRENGKGGGNPKLKRGVGVGVNPPDKAQMPDARFYTPERIAKNSKTDTESGERVAPVTDETPPAAPSETLSPVSPSAPKKRSGLAAFGSPLPDDWRPSDPLCEEVKTAFGMTDDDIRSELPAFHALNVQGGVLSSNWNSTFYLFCKRWKEHRDKQAAPRLELTRKAPEPPRRLPEERTEAEWNSTIAFYARTGRWTREFGPDPMSPACRAPRHLLKKHDIDFETGERRIPSRAETSTVPNEVLA